MSGGHAVVPALQQASQMLHDLLRFPSPPLFGQMAAWRPGCCPQRSGVVAGTLSAPLCLVGVMAPAPHPRITGLIKQV